MLFLKHSSLYSRIDKVLELSKQSLITNSAAETQRATPSHKQHHEGPSSLPSAVTAALLSFPVCSGSPSPGGKAITVLPHFYYRPHFLQELSQTKRSSYYLNWRAASMSLHCPQWTCENPGSSYPVWLWACVRRFKLSRGQLISCSVCAEIYFHWEQ